MILSFSTIDGNGVLHKYISLSTWIDNYDVQRHGIPFRKEGTDPENRRLFFMVDDKDLPEIIEHKITCGGLEDGKICKPLYITKRNDCHMVLIENAEILNVPSTLKIIRYITEEGTIASRGKFLIIIPQNYTLKLNINESKCKYEFYEYMP